MSKIIERVRERQERSEAARLQRELEQAKANEEHNRKVANAIGVVAAVALAMAAGSSRRGSSKRSKYDWLDHASGYSLFDKLFGG